MFFLAKGNDGKPCFLRCSMFSGTVSGVLLHRLRGEGCCGGAAAGARGPGGGGVADSPTILNILVYYN